MGRRAAPPAAPPPPRPRPRSLVTLALTASEGSSISVAPRALACPAEALELAEFQVLEHFRRNQPGPESFPGNATRIIDAIHQRDPDFNRLVQIVQQDAAISARLLQVANSAAYGGEEVQSVRGAAMRIGFRTLGEIALGFAGRSLFETTTKSEYELFPRRWQALFHESMTAAFSTASLAVSARLGHSDRAFLVGMLHDVGKPIALRAVAALQRAEVLDPQVFALGIDELIERVHVQIGTVMATTWALPGYLRAAIAWHEAAGLPPEAASAELHLVRIVDGVAALRAGAITEARRAVLRCSVAALRFNERRLRVAAHENAELAARVSAIFDVADPVAAAA